MKSDVLPDKKQEVIRSIKIIDGLKKQMSFFKLETKFKSDIGMAVDHLGELIKALFLIEPIFLFNVLKELETKKDHVHRVFQFVGEIDVAISIDSLRKDLPYYSLPAFTDKKKYISGIDIYHPLILNSIPNSIELQGKSALLTGSNMSGKTTFIRTIGINALLGQTLNTCFAKEFCMPPLKIHSAIRITDDLMNDKSYYFEEVLTIKEMLDESRNGSQNLFLLDELFKGTNTVERIASGKSVLNYLNKADNLVFISTHDLELVDYLKESYDLFHFTEEVENEAILFDYKIKPGNLKSTNAIRILESNEYPEELIHEAKQLAEEMNRSKIITN